jgi:hypothetical protein
VKRPGLRDVGGSALHRGATTSLTQLSRGASQKGRDGNE